MMKLQRETRVISFSSKHACVRTNIHPHSFLSSEDNMPSSSRVSNTALSAVGGHRNKPIDPGAVSADDRPDVGLYGPVFSQCQASSDRTVFHKNPVNVKHIKPEPSDRRNPALLSGTHTMMSTEDITRGSLCNHMITCRFFYG